MTTEEIVQEILENHSNPLKAGVLSLEEYTRVAVKAGQIQERIQMRNKNEYTDYEKMLIQQVRHDERQRVLDEQKIKMEKVGIKMLDDGNILIPNYEKGKEDALDEIEKIIENFRLENDEDDVNPFTGKLEQLHSFVDIDELLKEIQSLRSDKK